MATISSLPCDILSQIFRDIDQEDCCTILPFVCKSFYKALQQPACWPELEQLLVASAITSCLHVLEKSNLSRLEFESTGDDGHAQILMGWLGLLPNLEVLSVTVRRGLRDLPQLDLSQLSCLHKLRDLTFHDQTFHSYTYCI
ncbi:hypothetical protein WJX72_004581 [[Myrmecia] bisecta]|uniref:F-box domain-containing protein n=1 Tax=[Myrmecia] bisecta TaxID=41462 RepID=A0AAW1QQE1_9CHLO